MILISVQSFKDDLIIIILTNISNNVYMDLLKLLPINPTDRSNICAVYKKNKYMFKIYN